MRRKPKIPYISRAAEHSGWNGWFIRIVRLGKTFYRAFPDSAYEGSEGALQAAIACRDAVIQALKSGQSIAQINEAHPATPRPREKKERTAPKRDKEKACIYRLKTDDGWCLKLRRMGKEFYSTFSDRGYETPGEAYKAAVRVRDSINLQLQQGTDIALVFASHASEVKRNLQEKKAVPAYTPHIYLHHSGRTEGTSDSWVVRIRRKKKTLARYFTISTYGGVRDAYQAAKDFHEYVLERLESTGTFPDFPSRWG